MPGKVKVRIIAGRNLPVMDKSSDTSDAFVEVKLGNTTYKTEVYRHSLNPCWNSDCFRFEVDDEELQDEPLQIRIMDYDTYSANDAIGKVYIDLNPLLHKDSVHAMWGWFPIYDTMHGIRGEVHCAVKVDLFSDSNRYRQSSCGVRFFYSPGVPHGYVCSAILGFVEELVVNDDPEYQWIDKIRTPRASNEARQTLFSKLSGEVKRKIGLKALELGGNSVVGYQQYFDLEGESGIVVRGIGTAVVLSKVDNNAVLRHGPHGRNSHLGLPTQAQTQSSALNEELPSSLPSSNAPVTTPMINQTNHGSSINIITNSYATIPGGYAPNTNNATKDTMPVPKSFSPSSSVNIVNSDNQHYQQTNNNEVEHIAGATNNSSTLVNNKYGSPSKGQFGRGSSDPDLSTTPTKPSSSHSSTCGSIGKPNIKFMISPENLHLLEYPFITMRQFPPGFIANIGGTVSSRSVKLLDHINCPEDPETRDAWWMELRKEIRSHCRSLTCNAVLGYSEATYICDNVVILSASGTAVVLSRGGDHAQFINSNRSSTQDKAGKSDPENNSSSTNQSTGTSTTAPTSTSSATLSANKGEANKSTRNHSTSDYQQSPSLPPSLSSSPNCSICHIPYPESSVPFHSSLLNCRICKKAKVSDVLFMTIEPPNNIPIVGRGCLIQARVCRNKRDSKGEQCAKELSDSLPFLEHELHRQLLSKVKVKGMNAIFGLKVQISFGENMLIALATGTAAYVGALPPPDPPQISSGKGVKTTDLNAIQKLILESMSRNREHYGLTDIPVEEREPSEGEEERNGTKASDSDNETEYVDNYLKKVKDPVLDQVLGSKDGCVVLEVDDTEDADIISLMIDSDVPKGYEICNTETMPGLSGCFSGVLQTFAQVHRVKLIAIKQFGQQFDWIIQGLFVKLRRLVPCCLTDIKFHVDLPEQDLVQVTVLGSAIGIVGSSSLGPIGKGNLYLPASSTYRRRRTLSANDSCDELLFTMDEDHGPNPDEIDDMKKENFIPSETISESNGIELTPLSYVPGSHIQKYLGNLDFFFIRETTSIRESGGLNGFIHSFLSEVFAIVRAHVASLSGNAMVSLHLTQCVLVHNPHKNQAQCLINIAGDVVSIQNCSTKPIPVGR